jgi:hypothetical protein
VTLRVDGRTIHQPLQVAPDPRVKLPAAAFARQAALARRIQTAQARLARAEAEARALRKALSVPGRGSEEARRLDGEVAALQGAAITANPANVWAAPVTGLQTFRYLDGALGQLLHAVDGADADPSPDAIRGCERQESLLAATLAAWEALARRGQSLLKVDSPGGGTHI